MLSFSKRIYMGDKVEGEGILFIKMCSGVSVELLVYEDVYVSACHEVKGKI